ncbi:MAG: uroporphyrinogen decarboxylase [Planctomycetales bacterium 4484_113]|nr:MAG: uroporphyrinogen decarboxylase [Planctomycetales bacterium 4484_113]
MSDLQSSLFIRACHCEPTERVPVWFMRQAGRYLPEYQKLRETVDFLQLCRTPELVAEVTMQPVRRFGFDAAIIFSDILIPCEAMGIELSFDELGPHFDNPLRSPEDINRLHLPYSEEEMPFISEAIRILKRELEPMGIPLIGFVGGPFTVASYMIEGRTSRNFEYTKAMMYREPDSWHRLIELTTSTLISHLQAQIRAGVDAIQVFNIWTNGLSPRDYREFALPYVQALFDATKGTVPRIYFMLNSGTYFADMFSVEPDVISVDWTTDLSFAREQIPADVAIQGNLDPVILYGTPEFVAGRVRESLTLMQGRNGYIFNLGHGVLPKTPLESIQAAVDAVKTFSPDESGE